MAELCLLPACLSVLALPESPHPAASCQLMLINTLESANLCVYFASEMGSEIIYQHLSSIISSPRVWKTISISVHWQMATHTCHAIGQVLPPECVLWHNPSGSVPCKHSECFYSFPKHSWLKRKPTQILAHSLSGASPPLVPASSRFRRSCYGPLVSCQTILEWPSF